MYGQYQRCPRRPQERHRRPEPPSLLHKKKSKQRMYVSNPPHKDKRTQPFFFHSQALSLESEESHSHHAREDKGGRAVAVRASRGNGLGRRAGGMGTAVSGRNIGDLGSGGATSWGTSAGRLVASDAVDGLVVDMVREAGGSVLALGDRDGAEWGIGDRRLGAPAVGTRAAARLAAGLGPARAASRVGWLGAVGGDGADGRRDSDGTSHDVAGAVLDARGARGDGLDGSAVDRRGSHTPSCRVRVRVTRGVLAGGGSCSASRRDSGRPGCCALCGCVHCCGRLGNC